MSDEEIQTFITTFKSFMQHADVEEMNYLRRESTRNESSAASDVYKRQI